MLYVNIMRNLESLNFKGLFVAAFFSCLFALSCSKGGGEKTVPSLSVDPTVLSLAPGASGTLNVTSNVAWTVTPPTGYTVSPSSGSNNGTVTVTASDSPTNGFLRVEGGGKSVSVALSALSPELSLSDNSASISYEDGKTATFQISCNASWTVSMPSPKPDWLKSVTPLSGTGNSSVTITTGPYNQKTKSQVFLTVKSGSKTAYFTVTKEPAPNIPPTKPSGLQPTGTGVETITTFSWTASTDANGDNIKYTVMISKDNSSWTTVGTTENTSLKNSTPLDINTKYYFKVVADDGYEGGKTESDVASFTTTDTKSSWADGEVKQYDVNSDGSMTEVALGSSERPVKLIFTGDGYTQDLFSYGGQFDKEIAAGVKALFEYEPYKTYYNYFTIFVVAAYSNEAGISVGSDYEHRTTKVDTKFKCTWEGDGSTGIDCDADMVIEYASKCPGMKGSTENETCTNLTLSPISIIINADLYAGTNFWLSDNWGGFKLISIAQTPAREPVYSSYDGFAYTLRHEYGGHGFGLLDDEYVYYTTQKYPKDDEESFRYWQNLGAFCNTYLPAWDNTSKNWYSDSEHCNLSLTAKVEGVNWNTFASRDEYKATGIKLFEGCAYYGKGVYRSEQISCMDNNMPHFNTISRWKIYCRIKITAGETPSLEEFISKDYDKVNKYSSSAVTKSYSRRKCMGPVLKDPYHKKPYRLMR